MRSLVIMRELGYPVIFDATHSVQSREDKAIHRVDGRFAPYLAKAATAVGVDGLFIETHPEPKKAFLMAQHGALSEMAALWKKVSAIVRCANLIASNSCTSSHVSFCMTCSSVIKVASIIERLLSCSANTFSSIVPLVINLTL